MKWWRRRKGEQYSEEMIRTMLSKHVQEHYDAIMKDKGEVIMYSDVEAARNAVEDAERALADARGYLNRIEREEAERYPLEPQTTDVIVFWVRKMGKNYKFAAVKTEQGWFSTGRLLGFERKTWKGVVDWMREQGVTEFYPLTFARYEDRVSLSR